VNPGSSSRAIARPLRDRLRQEASRAILDAAEAVLAEEGLHARMEHIAARAGVAVGTLYNHFEHRDALLGALLEARREAALARVDAAVAAAAAAGGDAVAQLRGLLVAVAEHARAHGRFLAVLAAAGEGPGRPSPQLQAELVARAEAILSRGIAAGALRADPAGVFGAALIAMARVVLLRALDGTAVDPDAALEAVLELFLRGARA
jgi:AcrR family transcriptional regulator